MPTPGGLGPDLEFLADIAYEGGLPGSLGEPLELDRSSAAGPRPLAGAARIQSTRPRTTRSGTGVMATR